MGKKIKGALGGVTKFVAPVTGGVKGITGAMYDNTGMSALGQGNGNFINAEKGPGPGFQESPYDSSIEQRSGIRRPGFESTRDASGNLKSQYAYDPSKSAAYQQMNQRATGAGPSIWAQLQGQKQQVEQGNMLDQNAKSQLQAQGQAQAGLMRFGGLGGGARQSLARAGMKNQMVGNQDIYRKGMEDRLNIGLQDDQAKMGLQKDIANTDMQAQQYNLGNTMADITGKRDFDMNAYNQQMQAWGADQTAGAQAAAARNTKKGKK